MVGGGWGIIAVVVVPVTVLFYINIIIIPVPTTYNIWSLYGTGKKLTVPF